MGKEIKSTIILALILLAGTGLFFWKAGFFNKDYQNNIQLQIFERCLENEYKRGFNDGVYETEEGYCEGYRQGRFDVENQPEINRCK